MAKQLNVDLSFTADTSRAKSSIQDLQRSLAQLSSGSALMSGKMGINSELAKATTKAGELKAILSQSTNSKGLLDLSQFQKNLQKSKTTLSEYASHLNKLGPEGKIAFQQLAKAISTADNRLQKTTGLMNELWIAMKNTARWQLTSSALHTFIGGLQSAYGYAQNLNKSLNDIRIVSGKSTEEMARFAKEANTAAKNLGNSTLDYTKGALIYYQQGLEKQQVDERTNVTMKMKNVTGDSAEEVSSYMTAIWNNFNKAGDEAVEHYGDVLTALGASTASSTAEIAGGLEKFAAVSDTIGLSYENAASALATIVATTRQSEDVVGTALKTMFARMEGLKIDGAIEDDGSGVTSLNQYSEALMNIGVNIKDTSGQMKSMDDIIQETGTKWQGLSQDVKIATAQKVAGMRQYTQFMALMDNFDIYQQNLKTALNSDGTLQQQQEIYEESWEAANNRLKASFQGLWDSLINDDFFITLTNGFASLVEGVDKLVNAFGGLQSIIPLIGVLFTKIFKEKVATGISDLGTNIMGLTKGGKKRLSDLRKEANDKLVNSQRDGTIGGNARAKVSRDQGKLLQQQNQAFEDIKNKKGYIPEEDKTKAKMLISQQESFGKQYIEKANEYQKADEDYLKEKRRIVKIAKKSGKNNKDNFKRELNNFASQEYKQAISGQAVEVAESSISKTGNILKEINSDKELSDDQKIKQKTESVKQLKETFEALNKAINSSGQEAKEFEKIIDTLGQKSDLTEKELNDLKSNLGDFSNRTGGGGISDPSKFYEAGANAKISEEDLDKTKEKIEEQAKARAEAAIAEAQYEKGNEEVQGGMGKLADESVISASDAMTSAADAAMNLAMAYSTCTNAANVLKDSQASLGEKTTAVFMAFGTLASSLGSVGNAIKMLKTADFTNVVKALGGAVGSSTEEVIGLNSAIVALGPSLLFIIGVIVAFGIAFKACWDEAHKFQKKFEEAAQVAENASQHFNDATKAVDELNSSMESIDNKRDALKNMSMGTAEWTKALNDLNTEATDAVNNMNKLNNNLGEVDSEEYKGALKEVNKSLKDAGLGKTESLDMVEGEDYYYDSNGAFQYTEAGQIKFDTVKNLVINEAQVTLNAAKVAEKQAEIDANREAALLTGPLSDQSKFTESRRYGASADAYDAVVGALSRGELTNAELTLNENGEFSNGLEEMIDSGQISEHYAKMITSNDELRAQLANHAQVISENTEAMRTIARQDIVNDEEVNDAIYGEDSVLTKEEQEQYGSSITSLMADDVVSKTNRYKDSPDLYEKGDSWQNHMNEVADDLGYKEKDGKYYKENADGSLDKDNELTEDAVNNQMAYKKAVEETKEATKEYLALIKDTEEDNKALGNMKKAWEDNKKAINKANKEFEEHNELSKKTKTQMDDFAGVIRDDLAEALDITNDSMKESIIDGEFVAENADLIEKAMNGDVEALEKLQKKAAQKIMLGIETDGLDKDLKSTVDEVNKWINNSEFDKFEIGTSLDDTGMTESFQKLLNSGQMTANQMEALLSSIGYTPEIGYEKVWLDAGSHSNDNATHSQEIVANLPKSKVETDAEGNQTLSFDTEKVTGSYTVHTATKGKNADKSYINVPYIKGGKTKKVANVPPSLGSSNSSNSGGSGGGSGGGGKGGGGGRRATRRARHQAKEQKVDPYHTINKKLDSLSRKTEKVKEKTDQLYGKKRISNMDEVNKRLKKEIDLLHQKSDIITTQINKTKKLAQKELDYQRKKLNKNKELKNSITASDLKFDEFGNIKNYNDILDKLQKKRDQLIDKMNKKKTEEAQNKFKEKYLDPLDESIENIKQAMESYEAELQNWLDYLDSWSEKYNQILENKLETFNYKIEINAQINDNASKIIDYYLEQAEKDTYKMGEVFNLLFSQEGSNKLDLVLKQIKNQDDALAELDQMYKDGYITQANYVESLQKIFDSYGDNLDALNSLKESMEDYYSNVLEEAMSSLSNYQSLISQNTNALNHWKQVLDILGSGKNYSKILELQKQITSSAKKEYDNKLKTYEALKQSKKNLEEQLSQYEVGSEQYKILSKDIDNINEKLADSANEAMEAYENMLNSMQEELKLQLDQADKELDNFLSGVTGGFEELQKQMELASTRQQEYLTTTNKIYEMNKMLRNIRKDIDKTDNKAAKDRLNNFAKEISGLKEKDKLSQLDLKIAEARYKQLQAQIALEESQNAKTTVRLMRDNEGNYGYVYTSNEDDIAEKEQAVEDAGNSLYNIVLDANNDYNQKIVSYTRDMVSRLKEIRDSNLTDEEKAEQSAAVMKYYGDLISDAQSMLATAQNILGGEFNALSEAWSNSYSDNVNNMLINANDAIMNWSETSQTLNNQLQQLYKLFNEKFIEEQIELAKEGQENFDKTMGDYFGEDGLINEALNNLSKYLKEFLPKIIEALKSVEKSFSKVGEQIANEAIGDGAQSAYYSRQVGDFLAKQAGKTDKDKEDLVNKIIQADPNSESSKGIYDEIFGGGKHGYFYFKDGKIYADYTDGNSTDDKVYKKLKDRLKKEGAQNLIQFESGGYTGKWGDSQGKLALLHEKELILNKDDTKNMLAAVDIVRKIVDVINVNSIKSLENLISPGGVNTQSQELNQNVQISAEFPNVQDRYEIEAAFDNLVNKAAQYAGRNKD